MKKQALREGKGFVVLKTHLLNPETLHLSPPAPPAPCSSKHSSLEPVYLSFKLTQTLCHFHLRHISGSLQTDSRLSGAGGWSRVEMDVKSVDSALQLINT